MAGKNETPEMKIYREQQRQEAFDLRKFKYGDTNCDMCGTVPATEYHEIIPRGSTMANADAREASFQQQLCSCLCHECHDTVGPLSAGFLLGLNIGLYGFDAVVAAMNKMPEHYRIDVGYIFPLQRRASPQTKP